MSVNHFVGIDVSKADLYACFDETEPSVRFMNNPTGIHAFVRELHKRSYTKDNTLIGLESTASYHYPLCFKCTALGFTVKVINPLTVKKQNQTSLRRVKNDSKDASLIRYCLIQGHGYPFEETAETMKLKSLVRQRNSLANTLLVMNRQMKDIAYKQACVSSLLPNVYREIRPMLAQKAKELERELKTHRTEEQRLLQTIPGVGPLTAAAFISEVNDIRRFPRPKHLIAYAGLIQGSINPAPPFTARGIFPNEATRSSEPGCIMPHPLPSSNQTRSSISSKRNSPKENPTRLPSLPP